jgi:hypothetical protein
MDGAFCSAEKSTSDEEYDYRQEIKNSSHLRITPEARPSHTGMNVKGIQAIVT